MQAPTQPKYDGSDGARIDLTVARQWAQNYRSTFPNDIRSYYFGRDILDQILLQPGCTGIRIYFAINAQNERTLLIAGVDSSGDTMLPVSPVVMPGENSILDFIFPCPPFCPPGADL